MTPETAAALVKGLAANYTSEDFLHVGHHHPLRKFINLYAAMENEYPDILNYSITGGWGQTMHLQLLYINDEGLPSTTSFPTNWKL